MLRQITLRKGNKWAAFLWRKSRSAELRHHRRFKCLKTKGLKTKRRPDPPARRIKGAAYIGTENRSATA
jgi:hypothetical protein